MRRLLLLVVMFSFLTRAGAQKEEAAHRNAIVRLQQLYNTGQYENIFRLFSKEMAAALPLQQTVSFFSDLKRDAGALVSSTFRGYEDGFGVYATQCERARLWWFVSADRKEKITGLYIKPEMADGPALLDRNISGLRLPFNGSWTVVWGGTTREQNYHVDVPAQRHAFDFLVTDSGGKTFRNAGTMNDDYYAFGKEIIAPCAAEVVMVVDGIPDNNPGKMNPVFVTGNTVVLKTAHNEYLVFAHFKKHSIAVREGQRVEKGTLLGLCGNSGNSSEPHLHFHIQDSMDLNAARGVACYFDNLKVNGATKRDHAPVKGEKIENAE